MNYSGFLCAVWCDDHRALFYLIILTFVAHWRPVDTTVDPTMISSLSVLSTFVCRHISQGNIVLIILFLILQVQHNKLFLHMFCSKALILNWTVLSNARPPTNCQQITKTELAGQIKKTTKFNIQTSLHFKSHAILLPDTHVILRIFASNPHTYISEETI